MKRCGSGILLLGWVLLMDFEKYLDKALELGSQAVNQHGQQAWEMTLWLVRVQAMQHFLIAIIGLILLRVAYRNLPVWWGEMDKSYDNFNEGLLVRSGVLGWGGLIAGTPAFFVPVLYIWNWVGLFYPELYLAKMAMDKVL